MSVAATGTSELQQFVVGKVSDFPPGEHPVVKVGGREVGIYNVDGTFYAVLNLCPHALAPICRAGVSGTWLPSNVGEWAWGMDGCVLRCPLHGWEYDIRTGETIGGVDRRRLKTFPVSIQGDEVVVTMRSQITTATGA